MVTRPAGWGAAFVLGLLGFACARQGFPPGGPRDETAPYVVATEPDSGATRVPLDADVAITFSEAMNQSSVIDWILLSPPRDFSGRDWKGNMLRLSGGEDFPPDVTTTVIIGIGARDARENIPMTSPYLFVFSTGDSLDRGRIEGRLVAKNQRAQGTMVWAMDVERAAARPDTMLPDYVTQAGQDSSFVFIGLATDRRYRVMAHFDANNDREFDRDSEFLAAYPDTIWIDPAAPTVADAVIDFRNPRAPGSIAGSVIDSTGLAPRAAAAAPAETLAVAVSDTMAMPALADTTAMPAPADTTWQAFLVEAWLVALAVPPPSPAEAPVDTVALATARSDSLGRYVLRNLPPGLYRVEAYLDRNEDQRYDADEPAAVPADSVRVDPLEETKNVDLIVGRRPRPR